jgi:hypothetical protein
MLAATIIAILVIFGMGGGPFGELMTEYTEDPIKTTIVEKDRRKMALKELDSLKDVIKDFNKHVSKDIKRFEKLVQDYESTPEDFDQMFSSVLKSRKQGIEKLWDQRSAMLAHIQADEWQAIVTSARAEAAEKAAKK